MKLLGDFFVWEEDRYTRTLNRGQIQYVSYYCGPETWAVAEAFVWANQHATVIHGANATEFWHLWMAYLEEEERVIAQIRKADEEWRAREADSTTPPSP